MNNFVKSTILRLYGTKKNAILKDYYQADLHFFFQGVDDNGNSIVAHGMDSCPTFTFLCQKLVKA